MVLCICKVFFKFLCGCRKPTPSQEKQKQTLVKDRPWILQTLVQGDFSRKYVAIVEHSQHPHHIYILKKYTSTLSISSEFLVLSKINIPNKLFITPHEFFTFEHNYYFLYEREDTDLYSFFTQTNYKKYWTTKSTYHYILQIIKCVKYLHSLHIIHNDLKLENFVVNLRKKKIRLIDFECAQEWNAPKRMQGTELYMAPEIKLFSTFKDYVPGMQDIWSLGIMFAILLYPDLNFRPLNNKTQYHLFIRRIPENKIVSNCLQYFPKDRKNIHQLGKLCPPFTPLPSRKLCLPLTTQLTTVGQSLPLISLPMKNTW